MSVSLSPLAYLTVFKAATETHPDTALGVLVGLEDEGVLRATGAFVLPFGQRAGETSGETEDQTAAESLDAFVLEMLASLDRMNFEGYPIGVFAAGNVGAFPSSAVFSLSQTLKLPLVLLFDLPAFKALRSAPRAFLVRADSDVAELDVAMEKSGAAQLLLRHNVNWLELHVKPKNQRVQHFLERCLDNMGRLVASEPPKTALDHFRATRTAEALHQETNRAAKALLL